MNNSSIGYYLDKYETLLPSDTEVASIANSLWYQYIKGKFNDEVWANFYDRELFDNRKFNHDNDDDNYSNIIKTIKIRLINKQRVFERMFNAFTADFNPLWNVDGVTGTIRESTHTGTDTSAKSGSDTTSFSGGHYTERSGDIDYEYTGKDITEYKGSEKMDYKGEEKNTRGGDVTTTQSVTTYDDDTFNPATETLTEPTDTDTKTFTNRYDEKGFTNRKDERGFENRKDTQTFTNLKDDFNYNDEEHEQEYNSQLLKTLNLKDKDLEMIIRQGNIGVTRSDELITHALELFDSYLYDFVRYVTNDLISQVSYSIY